MGEACANPASYNLCGPAVSWTKSGMCDVRALNRARDCMFLCAGKWFAWWILDFFIASFPAKEHRAETMRIFSLPCWLCFLDKRSLSFSIQLLANREVPQARAKTQGQKKKKKKKKPWQRKTWLSSALLQCLKNPTFCKRDIRSILPQAGTLLGFS